MTDTPRISDFPFRSHDKLRYGDTDRQGHVNNAVFTTMYETGRVELLQLGQSEGLDLGDVSFVIARLSLDYHGEILWPGTVEIGTAVKALGNSSITFTQALFQNGKCVSTAESVVVQVDNRTRRSTPLSTAVREKLQPFMLTR
ncbi:MAG TPA: thioesterase family protein [Acidocella sp.]|jgi:acyl-CoA thioester hydrolase|uniref:acyl-CoA thioesterase n=1 Tax=Acidocella sp. TaxID=50710 RepID=UPI002B8AB5E8|nr:thioesterase family protein [Acidocella sp.]HVE23399.1 thioesterase family protein [Acidocella sp.]